MTPKSAWLRCTLGYALAGSILLWAAMPPLDFGWLAWIAPVFWIALIRMRELPPSPPRGRLGAWRQTPLGRWKWLIWPVFALQRLAERPYGAIWLAGFVFWLGAIHWLRLPHWATSFGWLALSFYLAFYLPVFIALSRVAVHRLRVPAIVAAPVVWTGLELARAHLLTGFTMASLGHTQYQQILLLQISDIFGGYGVSFLVMFVAACLGQMIPLEGRRAAPWPLLPAAGVLGVVLAYGHARTSIPEPEPALNVALIQGSIDIELSPSDDRLARIAEQLQRLSRRAIDEASERGEKVDLIVWPETMYWAPLVTRHKNARRLPGFSGSDEEFRYRLDRVIDDTHAALGDVARHFDTAMLIGVDVEYFGPDRQRRFNSAVLVTPDGQIVGRYDKLHLVMFGEYVPLADRWPWLNKFTPLSSTLTHGDCPKSFQVGPLCISPSVCYETVIPHVIRRQVSEAAAQGCEPNVLVNLTNDGWFWGSSELDMHLICAVFRAVECRKPVLISANTGFSAWIDGNGRILAQGRRRTEDVIHAAVGIDPRGSLYLAYGDWFSGLCLLACIGLAVVGVYVWRRKAV